MDMRVSCAHVAAWIEKITPFGHILCMDTCACGFWHVHVSAYSRICTSCHIFMAIHIHNTNKRRPPSQHSVNPACVDKPLPGLCRTIFFLCLGGPIDLDSYDIRWSFCSYDPAKSPCQCWPCCQRPACKTWERATEITLQKIVLSMEGDMVLQLVLLLHSELAVAIIKGDIYMDINIIAFWR